MIGTCFGGWDQKRRMGMKFRFLFASLFIAGLASAASYKAYYTTDSYGVLYDGVGRDWKGNIYIGAGRHSDYDAALFRYNPSTDLLEKLMSVQEVCKAVSNWLSNDIAGKIHTNIKQGMDNKLYFASHRSEDAYSYAPGYRGGHLFTWDPATSKGTDVSAPGVGANGQGIMDVALGLRHGTMYAVDETSFVYKFNLATKVLAKIFPYTTGSSTRNMFDDNNGRAVAPTSYGRMLFYDPRNDSMYMSKLYSLEFQRTCQRIGAVVKSASGDSIYFSGMISSGGVPVHIWRYIPSRDVMEDMGNPSPSDSSLATTSMALRWDLNLLYYFVGGTLYSINVVTKARATVLTGVPVGGQAISGSDGVDKNGDLWFTDKTNSSGRVYKITLGVPCAVCSTKLGYLDSAFLGVKAEEAVAPAESGGALQAYPNPFNTAVTFKVTERATEIRIFNTQGRMVDRLAAGRTTWRPAGLPAGVYVAEARTGRETLRKRLFLLP